MAITRTAATKQAATNAITALVDGGPSFGKFRFFAGGVGGTLIAEAICADPAYATSAADGDAELASTATGLAVAAGNMNAYTLTTSANVEIERGSVGTTGADINFASGVHREIGEAVDVTSYIINATTTVTP